MATAIKDTKKHEIRNEIRMRGHNWKDLILESFIAVKTPLAILSSKKKIKIIPAFNIISFFSSDKRWIVSRYFVWSNRSLEFEISFEILSAKLKRAKESALANKATTTKAAKVSSNTGAIHPFDTFKRQNPAIHDRENMINNFRKFLK